MRPPQPSSSVRATADILPVRASIPQVLHPARGDALTRLERELWRLRMTTLEVQVLLRGYFSTGDAAASIPDGLLFSLANQGLILISKFLEVWDDFGRLAKQEPRVASARKAVAPLIGRINVWRGIRTFRNTILAHPYTTKDGRLVSPWHLMLTHQAPTYHAEVILLLQCAMYAAAGVLASFYEEYKALGPTFRSVEPVPSAGPGIQYGSEIGPSVRPLLGEVSERLVAIGVPASNPVFAEFKAELQPKRRAGDGAAP